MKTFIQSIIGLRRWALIDDWSRQWWRLWSIRLQALGLFFLGYANMPMDLWAMVPADARALLPGNTAAILSALFSAAAMIARFVRQQKLIDDLRR